jgi:hypothetical protein
VRSDEAVRSCFATALFASHLGLLPLPVSENLIAINIADEHIFDTRIVGSPDCFAYAASNVIWHPHPIPLAGSTNCPPPQSR